MAISFSRYPIANVDNINAAIKSAIESTGMYDVTVSGGTATVKDNGTTRMTITPGTTNYATFVTLGGYVGNAFMVEQQYVWIGTAGDKAVIIGFQMPASSSVGPQMLSIVLCKSKTGKKLIFATAYEYSTSSTPGAIAICSDTSDNAGFPLTATSNSLWCGTTGLCAQSESGIVEAAVGVAFFSVKQPIIASPIAVPASSDVALQRIMIGEKVFLTDGFFVLSE